MNRDDIIRMARESGIELYGLGRDRENFLCILERFAALVAAAAKEEMLMAGNDQWLEEARKAEREACLKAAAAVDDEGSHNQRIMKRRIRAAIRARGQA
jgi:hypothetical protein